jgi:hypothetical protein
VSEGVGLGGFLSRFIPIKTRYVGRGRCGLFLWRTTKEESVFVPLKVPCRLDTFKSSSYGGGQSRARFVALERSPESVSVPVIYRLMGINLERNKKGEGCVYCWIDSWICARGDCDPLGV